MDLGDLLERSQHRSCPDCGAEFDTTATATALEQYADHSTTHQFTLEQWTNAYEKMRKKDK